VGKRPSFVETAIDRLRFLIDDHDFVGPESERPWDRIPRVTWVRYHRSDMTIEMAHVVGFMGEDYVYTRRRTPGGDLAGKDDWIELGTNTTHTGYQLRRAIDLQAKAIRSHLAGS
jgi:hypothetical protein